MIVLPCAANFFRISTKLRAKYESINHFKSNVILLNRQHIDINSILPKPLVGSSQNSNDGLVKI
jgi:hypothetical protein